MQNENKRSFTNRHIILFVIVLCLSCALVLALLAELLKSPKAQAEKLYQSNQLLLAASILSYDGYFLVPNSEGKWVPARYDTNQNILVPSKGDSPEKADSASILALFKDRILTRLTDNTGTLYRFDEVGLNEEEYLESHAKLGYADLPYKLIYIVLPNLPPSELSDDSPPYGYVIPVNGYGLWDAIYGYLGLASNGDTVLGMTWYDQKETPGLGAEIGLPVWQKQFQGKRIFQEASDGSTDPSRAPLGIRVVHGTVKEAKLTSSEAKSAVDGIAGASFTVSGVNEALKSSLEPYRPFLKGVYNRDGYDEQTPSP